jgi:hypothetical protein
MKYAGMTGAQIERLKAKQRLEAQEKASDRNVKSLYNGDSGNDSEGSERNNREVEKYTAKYSKEGKLIGNTIIFNGENITLSTSGDFLKANASKLIGEISNDNNNSFRQLTDEEFDTFESILQNLTLNRSDIKTAMGFAYDKIVACVEV